MGIKNEDAVFKYEGLEVPFFRVVAFNHKEYIGKQKDDIIQSLGLSDKDKLYTVDIKLAGNNDQITKGEDNISITMPQSLFEEQHLKYSKWLKQHEAQIVESGHGIRYNAIVKSFEEQVMKIAASFEVQIKEAFDTREKDFQRIIDSLENKNELLLKVIRKQEKMVEDATTKTNEVIEALTSKQNDYLNLLNNFDHDLTDFSKVQKNQVRELSNAKTIEERLLSDKTSV